MVPCISAKQTLHCLWSLECFAIKPRRLNRLSAADVTGMIPPDTRKGLGFDCNVYEIAIDGSWIALRVRESFGLHHLGSSTEEGPY
jgi:hypothetical protein